MKEVVQMEVHENPSTTPVVELLDGIYSIPPEYTISGTGIAACDESTLLYGPPGAGKSTEAATRTGVRVDQEDLGADDMTIVTYRRELADEIQSNLIDWGFLPDSDLPAHDPENPYRYWGTAHAAATRISGFSDRIDDDDEGMVDEPTARAFCNAADIEFEPSKPWFETKWTVFRSLYRYCKQNLLDIGRWRLPREARVGLKGEDGDGLGRAERTRAIIQQDSRARRQLREFNRLWDTEPFDNVVREYESWKGRNRAYDFWEQLEAGIVCDPLPPMEHVVIDEIHDAYPLMELLYRRWIHHADTVIVAGDPDQVINTFSGSSPAVIEELPSRVDRELPVIQLPQSYRCFDESFAAAARVLARHQRPPQLDTDGPGDLFRRRPSSTFSRCDEETWDLPPLKEPDSPYWLWQQYGPDILFLARTQLHLDAVAAHLDFAGVVYKSQDDVGGNWEARLGILRAMDVIQTVREAGKQSFLHSNDTFDSFVERPIEQEDVCHLLRHTDDEVLTEHRREAIETVRQMQKSATFEDFHEPVTPEDLHEVVADEFWNRYGRGRDSVEELVQLRPEYGMVGPERDRRAMTRVLDRYDSITDIDTMARGTKVLTAHASKGNEAVHTVVYDGIPQRVQQAIDRSREEAANEARVWYVALSRAQEGMHVMRDAFDFGDSYLPDDLEMRAAKDAREARQDQPEGGERV